MNKLLSVFIVCLAATLGSDAALAGRKGGGHHGGHHGHGGYSVGLWWGGSGWWGPSYRHGYGYPLVYAPYPRYRVVEQTAVVAPQPVVAAQPAPLDLWFYCTDPAGYHPYVTHCNTSWLEVVPEAAGSQSAPRLTR